MNNQNKIEQELYLPKTAQATSKSQMLASCQNILDVKTGGIWDGMLIRSCFNLRKGSDIYKEIEETNELSGF